MKSKKGITLISLVITVIVLAILASIATYSGINVIKSSKYTAFTAELKIMQTHVNAIYEENKEKTDFEYGSEIEENPQVQEQANIVFTEESSGITSRDGYRYWSVEYIKDTLKIEGVEQAFFVNLEKRSIVSYEGLEYEGETYYTLEQLPNGLYNINYEESNVGVPTFDVRTEKIGEDKWRITVSNIQYNGYIDKWQVSYQLEGKSYWNTTEDMSFIISESGEYSIKLVNEKIQSEEKIVQIVSSVEEAKTRKIIFEEKTTLKDNFGNKVIVPEGFKIVEDSSDNVTGGIVIEDVNAGTTITKGSQFVWIPVGTVYKNVGKTESTTINLNRYTFDSNGTPIAQGNNVIENAFQELEISTAGNTTAKNINTFKSSTNNNGGYYIGRYEARVAEKRTSQTEDSGLKPVTIKPNDFVYNYITQPQAAKLARAMYEGKTSTSDLMNSYAWDTAIVFLQEFDNRVTDKTKPYAWQNSLNTTIAERGTNNLTDINQQDKICNVWDMASGQLEWTTETSAREGVPCAPRGGDYNYTPGCTLSRHNFNTTLCHHNSGFRLVLYL